MPLNVSSQVAELRRMMEAAAGPGGKAAADAMALLGEREVKQRLSRYSHSRRTPTPSPAGEPPAIVSGTLRRSVHSSPAVGGAGRWISGVAPTVVYARIQELGGETGRNHSTTLPARPYVRPSVEELHASGELSRVAIAAFSRVVYGV